MLAYNDLSRIFAVFKEDRMKRLKSKKKITPDDYFRMGPIEVARFGKVVSLRNNMSKEEHEQFIDVLAKEYDNVVKDVDNIVLEIQTLVSKCNPLKLLQYCYNNFFASLLGITSEVQLSQEAVYSGRELEYVQSVIASTPIILTNDFQDQSEIYFLISEKIHKLYTIINHKFFICYTAKERSLNPEISPEAEQFIFESLLSMFYRGDRYPVYEIEHLSKLLLPHNEIFVKLFNISVNTFLEGLKNIQESLSEGIFSAFSDLDKIMKAYENFLLEKCDVSLDLFRNQLDIDPQLTIQRDSFINKSFINKFIGYDFFDLSVLTDWPDDLQRKLSWNMNEDSSFFSKDIYAGWPIVEMPIFQKPFICIEDKCYCFDYYNLFDNIYRVMQKTICKEAPEYKDAWNHIQMNTTEGIVAELFQKLLPGCEVLQSNYYPVLKSLKQCNENDLMIIYDNNLFIVEVKAGSYTYRSPISDIQSHISSLNTLVGKADSQAARTLAYLQSDDTVKIYDKDIKEKYEITLSDFSEVTNFCVTLDNFNEFAAKAEKIHFLSLKDNMVVISIDDLRVYADYFDSSCTFLHFIKQRKRAANIDKLALNDELDHLGMYIRHNMYSITAEKMEDGIISWLGYREKLDEYFSQLNNKGTIIDKPSQEIPRKLHEIIKKLDSSNIKGKCSLAVFLLDLSSEDRESLSDQILKCLDRQIEINRMVILSTSGDVPYSVFCHQVGVKSLSDSYSRDYTISTMLRCKEKSRLELHLYYNEKKSLYDIKFYFITENDIPVNRIEELKLLGDNYAESRIISYKRQTGKSKIGRNEMCPCGSGLKFKKCHGKS